MTLRIARKIDACLKRPGGRAPWWERYTTEQLWHAARRLHRSWIRMCPATIDEGGRRFRDLTPDFFASNRLESFAIRRPLVLRGIRNRRRVVSP